MHIETIKLWEDRDDVELTMFLNLNDPFFKELPQMRDAGVEIIAD